ncbi:MAG: ribbon-helix-helix domain-containing protein [Candidatus Hydrogenedentes bacterium]|nr:ribbon-helix-helix domain-containing protein [Candidatus Hydrogenedentota bacterium]
MSIPISIRLPDDIAERLDNVARETERPRSFIVQKAVESYLEDFADLQIALDRLRDTADPVVTTADMRKILGV